MLACAPGLPNLAAIWCAIVRPTSSHQSASLSSYVGAVLNSLKSMEHFIIFGVEFRVVPADGLLRSHNRLGFGRQAGNEEQSVCV
jgi:hypothetical protein